MSSGRVDEVFLEDLLGNLSLGSIFMVRVNDIMNVVPDEKMLSVLKTDFETKLIVAIQGGNPDKVKLAQKLLDTLLCVEDFGEKLKQIKLKYKV